MEAKYWKRVVTGCLAWIAEVGCTEESDIRQNGYIDVERAVDGGNHLDGNPAVLIVTPKK